MAPVRLLIFSMALLFPLSVDAGPEPDHNAPEYHLAVSFDVPRSMITGQARIRVRAGEERVFATGRLRILRVALNDRKVDVHPVSGDLTVLPAEDGLLTIGYEGVFPGTEDASDTNYGVTGNTIDGRGISLTGIWYPQPRDLAIYRLTAALPAGFDAVSEAETIERRSRNGAPELEFEFPHPLDSINLIATDRYEVTRDRINGIDLYAYFFPGDRSLAKTYLRYAKTYLARYEKLLTPYPHRRFSIVENFLPTGYSMPSYTLLGQDVVRLPFIVESSLGHEILHQWFGNLVYLDYAQGNWAEGLTTYLADHLYEEEKGRGWTYRKGQLIDYGSYVHAKNEFALKDFRVRTDFASRSIGYGKTAMFFHMLMKHLGKDAFLASLKDLIAKKEYRKASWQDLRTAFEGHTGKDLGWFFRQWVDEKGIPDLRLENPVKRWLGDAYEITFDVRQEGPAFTLDLPVRITSVMGIVREQIFKIDGKKKSVEIRMNDEPSQVVIDGNYDLARRLSDAETPPVISGLLGDPEPLIVLPPGHKEFYAAVIESFRERGGREREADDLKDTEEKSSSLILLGNDNPVYRRLYGETEKPAEGFHIRIRKNPWDSAKVTAVIYASSKEEVDTAFRKIFHYGKYSRLSFKHGRNVLKKTELSERGIRMELQDSEVRAVDLSRRTSLSDVIDGAAVKKIVYVGEAHDRFAHHKVQLQIIKSLYKKNPRIALGMEMFQVPFQEALDAYIDGSIKEREFLKRSEYFDRWGFDFNLYKPILDFARREGIPVVALNTPREITKKVSREGLLSLSEEEKKQIPKNMDFTDERYRKRLEAIFGQHSHSERKAFDHFYEAQVLWDETMSQSIDAYLQRNPDRQMIVIAGSGHLAFGSGIPKRTFRRNGYDFSIILNDLDAEADIAQYMLYPEPAEGITAPKLMATLQSEDGKVRIADFPRNSVSREAGLRVGDTILALDGEEVGSVGDIKLALFYKSEEDPVTVTVLRKRVLLGPKRMDFRVKLL